jgi:hypothetical protein
VQGVTGCSLAQRGEVQATCAECVVCRLGGGMTSTAELEGRITVWTSDSSPLPIDVLVDGVMVGRLTAYRSSAPDCGAESAGAVSVSRPPGTYLVSARVVQGQGTWPPMAVAVSAGRCRTVELRD